MDDQPMCRQPGCCGNPVARRDFLKYLGLGTAAMLSAPLPVMAGPFEAADFEKLVPSDKKLSPEWVRALFARGSRTVYRGAELKYIGMPVGGLCSGQLYLGGDGRLWHWDIFNQSQGTGDSHYAHPPLPQSPVDQGFAIRVNGVTRTLDAKGFPGVTFTGEYPIGCVEYRDPACPVAVSLEAFSPFIPLNVDDSSLPATVMRFTLANTGPAPAQIEFGGWLENKVGLETAKYFSGVRRNQCGGDDRHLLLACSIGPAKEPGGAASRPKIVFAEFEGETFAPWKVEGEAFGPGPTKGAPDPIQRLKGFKGASLANSWALKTDAPVGKLTSPGFNIERRFINFLIGGGNHPQETCLNLVIEGAVVRTATGRDTDEMAWASWSVADLEGKPAHLEIIDKHSGGWGHIDIDQIEFSDDSSKAAGKLEAQADYGTMGLALLETTVGDRAVASLNGDPAMALFSAPAADAGEQPLTAKLVGALVRSLTLAPGESRPVSFVITWHFPNLVIGEVRDGKGRYYATRFDSATAVADYVAAQYPRLYSQTKLWHDTWYDATLPYWFLDRTLANASILATSTVYRFANGRFYGWEGVGCCAGTCTHVWHYEQTMGRLFPELDKLLRERTDYGVGFNTSTGVIGHRGELAGPAVDGQAGTILRTYRDHQMSADSAFLQRHWPNVKKALQWLILQDTNEDGILEGPQANTLDAEWFGAVPWLSGLYLAALRSGEEMAREMGDDVFARRCRALLAAGMKNFVPKMWNGEYFIQVPDPKNMDKVGSYEGCEIDQVLGQHWAFQVGLGRVLPPGETKQALASLWRYNFTPDVGPYRAKYKSGRWYAMAGEAGTLMCAWPKGEKMRVSTGYDYYFNECMNGFEHQLAGHMVWEGMLLEGFAIERAVHDRYHAARRNPWNEVECGDHYARSMASYGVFTAACGYEHHGPQGYLAFAPRLTPENFKAAFTSAEGWGALAQTVENGRRKVTIEVKWGKLRLKTLGLAWSEPLAPNTIQASANGQAVAATVALEKGQLRITLATDLVLESNQKLEVVIS